MGGGAKSRFYLGIFADAFNTRIMKTNIDQDAGALGAAAIAAVGTGLWKDFTRSMRSTRPSKWWNRTREQRQIRETASGLRYGNRMPAQISETLNEVEI